MSNWIYTDSVSIPDRCAACGQSRSPGELLRVVDRQGVLPPAAICRYAASPRCLAWAGRAERTLIELLDPAAARAFDRSDA
jgi:hypothetical protein